MRIQGEDGGELERIGEIEVWYIDGSRAADNELDIVDVCSSLTQAEHEYARAIYIDDSVDTSIVDEPFYNNMIVIHSLALTTDSQGLGLEARIIRKIVVTLGCHCAAIVFNPDCVGIAEDDELELTPTKTSSLFALTDF